ncbi:MAG: hypothetical protein AB1894_26080 [Chloroflexota bacterium]
MATFSGEKIVAWIGVPGTKPSFELGIFDGDFGKDDNGSPNWSAGHWDGYQGETLYTLYADPLKDGDDKDQDGVLDGQDPQIMQWPSSQMPNNQWFDVTIDNVESARAPSQVFYYRLEASMPTIGNVGYNNFKFRSTGYLSTGYNYIGKGDYQWSNSSVGIMGALATWNDFNLLYPNYKSASDLGSSPYSGEWVFYLFVPNDKTTLELWDGDFDRGTSPTIKQDLDDLNTDGKPEWAKNNSYVVEERAGLKGAPPDDYGNASFRRSPAAQYELIDPDGQPVYINEEPSGTEEWERFVMSTDPNANPDLQVDRIKPGLYTLTIQGLDLSNAVWLRTNLCIGDPEDGCGPCVWPGCDNTACPRTIGYWKNNVKKVLIDKKTNGVQETPETLDAALTAVAQASPLFRTGINIPAPAAIDNPVRLTDQEAYQILMRGASKADYPGDKNTMLARALQQNLAAWLNLASGKISDNTVVTLNVAGGAFEGTIWEALTEAQTIILNNDTANMERAKDIGDQINNGLLGEDASVGSCDAGTGDSKDFEQTMPKDKQPPKHKDMPKAPKPDVPDEVTPGPEPVCTANNTYGVENPTNNPFYGIKFEFQSGTEVRDGGYDIFEVTLPAGVVQAMTSVQLEAKSATNSSIVTLEADFTSPVGGGEPIQSESGLHGFSFLGAVDNGDGTYTLSFMIVVYDNHGLSHATIGLPDGAVPTESGSYTSESCTAP